MELVTCPIPLPGKGAAKARRYRIVPIGDIQWSGRRDAVALEHLKRTIGTALDYDPPAYFLGMGDFLDFASPSNRRKIAAAALHDTAQQVVADKALELVFDLFERVLKPTVGRWLGVLEGHHWTALAEGDTTDMRFCQLLRAPFLGSSAFVRLLFQTVGDQGRYPVTLWAAHGCGGGQKTYAPVMRLENSILPYWEGADVFLIGHMTKMASTPINRISPRWAGHGAPELVHRKVLLVGCGGYSKAYVERARVGQVARGGYAEQRLFSPLVLGSPTITIWPRFAFTHTSSTWAPEITVEL